MVPSFSGDGEVGSSSTLNVRYSPGSIRQSGGVGVIIPHGFTGDSDSEKLPERGIDVSGLGVSGEAISGEIWSSGIPCKDPGGASAVGGARRAGVLLETTGVNLAGEVGPAGAGKGTSFPGVVGIGRKMGRFVGVDDLCPEPSFVSAAEAVFMGSFPGSSVVPMHKKAAVIVDKNSPARFMVCFLFMLCRKIFKSKSGRGKSSRARTESLSVILSCDFYLQIRQKDCGFLQKTKVCIFCWNIFDAKVLKSLFLHDAAHFVIWCGSESFCGQVAKVF